MLVWRCSLILVRSSQDDAIGGKKGKARRREGSKEGRTDRRTDGRQAG
jgi:hypothetical protein